MNKFAKILTSWWMCLLVLGGLTALRVSDPVPVETLRLNWFDYIMSTEPVHSDQIVLLEIGETTLQNTGYPINRSVLGNYVIETFNSGGFVLGINTTFANPSNPTDDEFLSSVFPYGGVVLSQMPSIKGLDSKAPHVGTGTIGGDALPYLYNYPGIVTNLEIFEDNAFGVGVAVAPNDVDGKVRQVPVSINVNDKIYPSFALEMLRNLTGEPSYQVFVNELGIEAFRIPPYDKIITDSNGRVYIDYKYHFDSYELGKDTLPDLSGKAVIMGVSAEGIVPQVNTPYGAKLPHEIQANILQTMLDGTVISRPSLVLLAEIISSLVLGLLLVLIVYRSPLVVQIPLVASLTLGSYVLSVYSYDSYKVLIDASFPLLSLWVIFTQASFNNFYRQFRLRQQISKQFSTYLSPKLVKQLQKNPEMLQLGGETKQMTYLFCDIRGFTPISEQYKTDPQGLTHLINRFLTPMTDIIIQKDGMIDKYMGDCIMAVWNAPLDIENQEHKAVYSALYMLTDLKDLNEELTEEGLLPINIGIGINTGEAVVGNMGSDQRFDYSVLGDPVNLGARLEGQSKSYGVELVVSENTKQGINDDRLTWILLDKLIVKGKKEPVNIYTVFDIPVYKHTVRDIEDAWDAYVKGEWDKSINIYSKITFSPLEDYSKIMVSRCKKMKQLNPSDWEGIWEATTK